ncbi:MAG: VOC family protein [Oscillospiraceae bacterium]|jgi:methylmalonyl-CoA/ethylmalonyl-CoA epimerase
MELYIQHIGICVNDIDQYLEKLKTMCDAKEVGAKRLYIPQNGQISALVQVGENSFYELMGPLGDTGVVPKFLAKHGEGFHHIGMYCSDIMELAKRFEDAGLHIIGDPKKGNFFSHPKETGGILYEFSSRHDADNGKD